MVSGHDLARRGDFAGAPLLRTQFALDDGHGALASAEAAVSSLGVFEAFVNGHAVGRDVLSPGWSSYEWRCGTGRTT